MDNLTLYEKKVLKAITDGNATVASIASSSSLKSDTVLKALEWLKAKGLVTINENVSEMVALTDEGNRYLKEGLPERKLLDMVKSGKSSMKALASFPEARIGIVWLSKLGIGRVLNGEVKVFTEPSKMKTEVLLAKAGRGVRLDDLDNDEKQIVKIRSKVFRIIERKDIKVSLTDKGKKVASNIEIIDEESRLTPQMLKAGSWRNKRFRKYDVSAPTPPLYPGKRHFAKQAMDFVRRIWLEMGFVEMEGPLIDTTFWNFDALFVPQDHPSRELQDTFYLPLTGDLPDSKIVSRVRKAHEKGVCGSRGWRYKWDEDESKRMVLRTHTTVLSARTLAKLKEFEIPAKFFSVGRVFRNEALDWKHLFEFTQSDGIVVGNVNFRHLLGYLKEFLARLGFTKVRFRPSYFPYTEMSVEPEVWHPVKKEWVELGGAGIFRPEVVEPLLGKDIPVLAWGLGVERLIIDYYNITDVRDIYKNDVQALRETKMWW